MLPPIQQRLLRLEILQIENQCIFLLTFVSGAIVAHACDPENFLLNEDISSKSVEKLLKRKKSKDKDDDDDDDDD